MILILIIRSSCRSLLIPQLWLHCLTSVHWPHYPPNLTSSDDNCYLMTSDRISFITHRNRDGLQEYINNKNFMFVTP